MDVIVAFVTVMLALPTIPFKRAVTVVDPGVIAVSTPRNVLPLLTVATEGDEEVHFTAPVTFCVVPSANVPVAICSGSDGGAVGGNRDGLNYSPGHIQAGIGTLRTESHTDRSGTHALGNGHAAGGSNCRDRGIR